MNKLAFSKKNRFGILAATLLLAVATEQTHPGEPLIFRDSNDKNSAPKEKFDLNAIRPHSPSFDKKSSSVVEGVIAPWQHPSAKPSQQKLTPQQRKRLLNALDRKKNWGMQDSAEMRNSDSPAANDDQNKLDANQTQRNYNRTEESSLEKYSANRNSKKQPAWKNSPFNNFNNADANPDNQTANEKEQLTFIDSFATVEDFEMRLDSIFDQSSPNEGIQNEISFNSVDNFLEFNEFQTPTETSEPNSLFSPNIELDAQTSFSPSQSFNPLLSPSTAWESGTIGRQLIPRNGLNLQNSSIAAPSAANLFNNGLFSNPTTELPAANNPTLPSTSAIQSPSSPLGNSPLIQPSELELLNQPATPNLLKQPAIFQLPKRSF